MKLLDDYFKLKNQVFEHFGYVEDWVRIPIEDYRNYYWFLDLDEYGGGELSYNDKLLTAEIIEEGDYYVNTVYTQRFLSKWIYETDDYTLICVDTETDGNKLLAILENTKKQYDIKKKKINE